MRLDQQLQHQSLVRMLKESIYSMCRNSLAYDLELNVEGLIGITLDKRDVFLVNINESFHPFGKPNDACDKTTDENTKQSQHDGTARKRKKRRGSASSSNEDPSQSATEHTASSDYVGGGPERGSRDNPEEIDDCDAIVIKEEIEYDEEKYHIPLMPGFEFSGAAQMSSHSQSSEGVTEVPPDPGVDGQDYSNISDRIGHRPFHIQPEGKTPTSARQMHTAMAEPGSHLTSSNLPATTSDSQEQIFRCQYCGRVYQSKAGRYLHEKLHNGQAILCRLCGKAFSSRAHLQRHAAIHQEGETFACGKCGEAFSSQVHLQKHMFVHGAESDSSTVSDSSALSNPRT